MRPWEPRCARARRAEDVTTFPGVEAKRDERYLSADGGLRFMEVEKVDVLQVGKLDAANRQLDCAIDLFFSGGDPVCVHSLAGAASMLLSDLIETRDPGESWDRMAQADNDLSPSEYFEIVRNAQNFLKHAKHDSNAVLRLNERDTEGMIMIAVLNSSQLQRLSIHQQVVSCGISPLTLRPSAATTLL